LEDRRGEAVPADRPGPRIMVDAERALLREQGAGELGDDSRQIGRRGGAAVLIGDDATALAILHELKAVGVRISLDDFGTGYSSLSYLKRFPFDKIKIDRCFVSDISEADSSSSIVQAVVNIAAALNMTTAGEGVETAAQRDLLRKLGCTEMQGYLFSPPRPAADVKRLFGAAEQRAIAAA